MAVVSSTEPFLIITELMVNGALLDYLRSDIGKKLKFEKLIDMNAQVSCFIPFYIVKNTFIIFK